MNYNNYLIYIVVMILIVGIVAVSAVISNSSLSNLAGQALSFGTKKVVKDYTFTQQATCTDTDDGQDYEIAGSISGQNVDGAFNMPDNCLNDNELQERYCNQYGYPMSETVDCTTELRTEARCVNNRCRACVIQITDNDYFDQLPDVHKNYVVWHGVNDPLSQYMEIFVYNIATGNTRKITSETESFYPKIYGGNIVWQQWDVNDYEIMLHNIYSDSTTQITNTIDSEWDPKIHKDMVTWDYGGGSYSEIFFYDLTTNTLKQLTNNNATDEDPDVHDGAITWVTQERFQDREIALYKNGNIKEITSNDENDRYTSTDGQYVVWSGNDGNDYEIYLYDIANDKTIQITDDEKSDYDAGVSGNYVIWDKYLGFDSEIHMYNISTGDTKIISNNNMDDFDPIIEGNLVAWSSYDSNYNVKIQAYDIVSGITKTYDPNFTTQSILTMHARTYHAAIDSDYNIVWFGWDGYDWEIYLTNFNWC